MENEKNRSAALASSVTDTRPEEIPMAPVSETGAPTKSGRTPWDLLFDLLNSSRIRRKAFNWTKAALLFVFAIVLFGFVANVYKEVIEVKALLHTIPEQVAAMKQTSANGAESVARLERKFDSSPLVYWQNPILTDFDIPTCKSRAVEALERSGATNIGVADTNAVHGKFSASGRVPSVAVIFCPVSRSTVIMVADLDEKTGSEYRDKLAAEFRKLVGPGKAP